MGMLRRDKIGRPVTSLTLSKDENLVLVGTLDSTIRLFDKNSGKLIKSYIGHKNNEFPIQSTFDNSDSMVFSGSEDGCIHWWNTEEGSHVGSSKSHSFLVSSIDWHPKQNFFLTASSDETIKLWGKT